MTLFMLFLCILNMVLCLSSSNLLKIIIFSCSVVYTDRCYKYKSSHIEKTVGHDFSDSVNEWSLYTVIFLLVLFDIIFGEVFLCDKCNICLFYFGNIMCGPTTCLRTTNNEYQAIEFRISTEPSIHRFISYFWNWIFYSCISLVTIILKNIIDEQYYYHLTLYFFTLVAFDSMLVEFLWERQGSIITR